MTFGEVCTVVTRYQREINVGKSQIASRGKRRGSISGSRRESLWRRLGNFVRRQVSNSTYRVSNELLLSVTILGVNSASRDVELFYPEARASGPSRGLAASNDMGIFFRTSARLSNAVLRDAYSPLNQWSSSANYQPQSKTCPR